MPKKSRRDNRQNQALNRRLKEQAQFRTYIEKLTRAQKKERDDILLRVMKRTTKVGVYQPKELKLTKYRRYRATKALREYGEFLDPRKFFFVKAPPKAKKQVFERAESLQIKHSRSGLFVPREGHKRAKFRQDKKRKEFFIERVGKTKRGPTKGVRYRTITPLASVDELDNERDRLRRMAKALGPLRPNDRVSFKVIENGLEGYSHTTFSNIELLINYLEHYRKSIPAKINFFRHIVVEKTTASKWFSAHPSTNAGRKGRKARDEIRAREAKQHGKETKPKGRKRVKL